VEAAVGIKLQVSIMLKKCCWTFTKFLSMQMKAVVKMEK